MEQQEKDNLDRLRGEIHHSSVESGQLTGLTPLDNNLKVSPSIPTIRTLEGDMIGVLNRNELNRSDILAKELDRPGASQIQDAVEDIDRKKKIVTIVFAMILLLAAIGAGIYVFYPKKQIVTQVKAPEKVYTIKDIWQAAPLTIVNNTTEATSTDDYVVVNVKDFNNVYYFMLNNEELLSSLAKDKFGYEQLESFSDISVNNQDLRIADGATGPLVYGYVGKGKLLISNSLKGWLDQAENFK